MIFYARGYHMGPCRCGQCPPDLNECEHVRATTEAEALGFLLERYPESQPEWWTLYPLPDEGESGIMSLGE